jgi:ATP-binding cassette subfamily B protein
VFEADSEPVSARELLRRLRGAWRLCWLSGRLLATSQIALALIAGLLSSAVTWSTKTLIDGLIGHRPASVLIIAVGGLVGAGLVTAVQPRVTDYLKARLNRRATLVMNDRLFTAVNGFMGLSRFENPKMLDQIRTAQQSTSNAIEPATTGMLSAGQDVISLAGLLITVSLIAPVMTGVIVASAVPILFAQLALSRRYVRTLATMSARSRRQYLFASLSSDARAVKEIRLLGLDNFFKHRMLLELVASNEAQQEMDRHQMRVQSLLSLLSAVISGGGLLWAVWAAYRGQLTVGSVSAFAAAITAAQVSLGGLVSKFTNAHQALLVLGYYLDVVQMVPDFPQVAPNVRLPALRSGIELRNVWFRYDDDHPWVLRGLNLYIPSGRSVALVGLNGAGKSTLVKLLCRFYDPTHGAVLWDGVDIRAVPVEELRHRLGVLFQDFMQYDLTAGENVGVGDLPNLTDLRRIAWASSAAGIHEKIISLPQGYDTMLSRVFFREADKKDPDKGAMLSGGQWQRVALARTFMREGRDLLILDEPSSGLDAEAEYEIHERLRKHRTGRTSVLVSHRMNAVRDADVIVVLVNGQIAEQGDHESLMRRKGHYERLFSFQAKGYGSTTPPAKVVRTQRSPDAMN